MGKRKYAYFHVATPTGEEGFENYHEALRFYGKSEKPSTLYGVTEQYDEYICIKSKYDKNIMGKTKDYDVIYDLCDGLDVSECEDVLKKHFNEVRFCDEKIDDGLDDGVYLMMRSFDVDDVYVKFYYGSDDYIVTHIVVSN